MALTVIILDRDRRYAERLADAFLEDHGSMVQICITDAPEGVAEILEEDLPYPPMIVADQEFDLRDERFSRAGRLYLVRAEGIRSLEGIPAVSRYAGSEEIYQRMMYAWMESTTEWCRGMPDQLARVLMATLTGEDDEDTERIMNAKAPLGPMEVLVRSKEHLQTMLDHLAPQVRLVVVVAEKGGEMPWDSSGACGDADRP
ncbi:MAG: hypothetical protein IIY84_02370 [Eubacterium sp.]|nr:hypothetical protein [Eubacterium sp.]